MIIDNMAPPSEKRTENSIIASQNVVFRGLIGMPMDIIFEIFEYLDPLDLLQLARTTKALRAILMSRSSLFLWKRVRRDYHPMVDTSIFTMPDGPEGMSEPQYASLAFDLICDGCGISDSDSDDLESSLVKTFWNAQLKSCNKCISSLLAIKLNLEKFDLFQTLPSWLIVLLQERNLTKRSMHDTSLDYCYSLKQAQIWSQEYSSLSGSSGNLREWQRRIIEKNALTIKHIDSIYFWKLEIICERQLQIVAIDKALIIKLFELGWGEEIRNMTSWEIHDLCRKFTVDCKPGNFKFPQVWSSKGSIVLKKLKAIQTARIEKERQMLISSRCIVLQEIYNEYIRGLPADALIPTIADVALSPSVHAIVTDERTRTDFIVTRQTFEDINLLQNLPSIFSDWKIRLDDELVRMVQVELSEPFTKDQLLLATTVFYCDACHIDLFYPQVLVHKCSITHERKPLQCPAWNSSGNIKFNRDVHQAVIDIIDILGLDPKAVTFEDMIDRNDVLQCLSCSTTCLGRMTMFWNRAIEHSREQHNCRPSMISWKVPGDEGRLTLQARLVRELAISDRLGFVRPRFKCGVCGQRKTLVHLKQHFVWAHEIQSSGEHYILFHPDAIVLPEID